MPLRLTFPPPFNPMVHPYVNNVSSQINRISEFRALARRSCVATMTVSVYCHPVQSRLGSLKAGHFPVLASSHVGIELPHLFFRKHKLGCNPH